MLAVVLQVVIVAICVAVLIYVRLGLGPRARYAGHLAFGWGFMGLAYLTYAVISGYSPTSQEGTVKDTGLVISSALSLISSAFMLASWYMMRDERLEEASAAAAPLPTMSKQFVSILLISLNVLIAIFLAFLTQSPSAHRALEFILILIDVSACFASYFLVGLELFQMQQFPDPQEGTLFPEGWGHPLFRWITFLMFIIWALMQFPVIWGKFYLSGPVSSAFFKFPTGQWYTWLAVVKLLCGTCASVLIMHALPSVRWKHRLIGKRAGGKKPVRSRPNQA